MTKIAIITDLHCGVRNDSQIFMAHQKKFYEKCFFPYIDKHDIKMILGGGDTFDRRKYINYKTLASWKGFFFDEMLKRHIPFHTLIGNHDTYHKNTNETNSMELVLGEYPNIIAYSSPQELSYDDMNILMMPWICPDNYEQSMEAIEKSRSPVMLGHLEINGFNMHKGVKAHIDHGFSAAIFQKFKLVMSGHFHTRSKQGNIQYLGAPYEMTWSDYNDARGFSVYDTETGELEFIQNPYRMFYKFVYDDTDVESFADFGFSDLSQYEGSYVKVILTNKTNPFFFDRLIDELIEVGVANIQVVEDHLNSDMENDEDIINEAESTMDILEGFVQTLEYPKEKILGVDKLLKTLYSDALSMT